MGTNREIINRAEKIQRIGRGCFEMRAEKRSETERGVAVRDSYITKDVYLCFPRESGGDIQLEVGDRVLITVLDRQEEPEFRHPSREADLYWRSKKKSRS